MLKYLFGLLSALFSLIQHYAKRKYSPNVSERLSDWDSDAGWLLAEIHRSRRAGNDARADALLRRLHQRRVLAQQSNGVNQPGPARERHHDDASVRNEDPSAQ